MTLYARADINAITVGGGCGQTHERPRTHFVDQYTGEEKYDIDFPLTCAPCEQQLANDTDWAKNPATVRLTPDQELIAEAEEKTGNALTKQMATAMADAAVSAAREVSASR
jgi:hypothetical protein